MENPLRTPPRKWLIAAAAAVAVLGTTGIVWYQQQSSPSGDQPSLSRPDAGGEGEEEATIDKNAKGSAPRAFTVKGHTVRIDTRKLTSTPPKKKEREEGEEAELRETGKQGTGPAAKVQTTQTATAAPSPTVSVKGLDFANCGTAECDSNNGGDPTAVYDVPSGKWVLADFAWVDFNKGPFYECVAVSSGSDPVNSTWTFYSVPAGEGKFPDYPKFGRPRRGVLHHEQLPPQLVQRRQRVRAAALQPGWCDAEGAAREHELVVLQPDAVEHGRRVAGRRSGVHRLDLERQDQPVEVPGGLGERGEQRVQPDRESVGVVLRGGRHSDA